ncbi:MAG: carboxynorspermidine decarboxylase [Verrucomicrobiales bacterium]|jgi:carboxynorspermidine decarboxylase
MPCLPFAPTSVPSPCFVIDEAGIERNLQALKSIHDRTGCAVLAALKAFAAHDLFPMMREYLQGTCCSGPHEAQLGAEMFGGETHVYAPAFKQDEIEELSGYADHFSFNSLGQWSKFGPQILAADREIACGLRINPEQSEAPIPLYDPCAPGSRFGIRASDLEGADLTGITGLHFHTLCEQFSPALERTVEAVEQKFGRYLGQMEWINFGGGHWITQYGYDVDHLCRIVDSFQEKHGVKVYLEPGEAIGVGAGYLVSEVLDIIYNDGAIAILDSSATAHFGDALEMPFTPGVWGASTDPEEMPWKVKLGGLSCLSGDFFGTYSLSEPLTPGDRIVFMDAAHYTMVKTTHFNGLKHPAIAVIRRSGATEVIRKFGYSDYRDRLS